MNMVGTAKLNTAVRIIPSPSYVQSNGTYPSPAMLAVAELRMLVEGKAEAGPLRRQRNRHDCVHRRHLAECGRATDLRPVWAVLVQRHYEPAQIPVLKVDGRGFAGWIKREAVLDPALRRQLLDDVVGLGCSEPRALRCVRERHLCDAGLQALQVGGVLTLPQRTL